jgi:hypothetical protein
VTARIARSAFRRPRRRSARNRKPEVVVDLCR